MKKRLTQSEVFDLLRTLGLTSSVTVRRITYKNSKPIVRELSMGMDELKQLIADGIEEGHIFGGDMEIPLPEENAVLVGHHDGIFWLERREGKES